MSERGQKLSRRQEEQGFLAVREATPGKKRSVGDKKEGQSYIFAVGETVPEKKRSKGDGRKN